MDLRDRRETYNGAGETLARAVEMVVTPAVFGLAGWGLDRALGTAPVLMLVLALVCVAGMFVRAYYAYSNEMAAHEARAPWARRDTP